MNTIIIYQTLKLYAAIPQAKENIPAAWYEAQKWETEDFIYNHRALMEDRSGDDSFLATPEDERRLFYSSSIPESTIKFQWHLN